MDVGNPLYIVVQHFRNASHTAFVLAEVRKDAALNVVPASTMVRVGICFPSTLRYIRSNLSSLLKTISSGILTWNEMGAVEYRVQVSHEEPISLSSARVLEHMEFG
jgi:hypothetical protein